MWFEKIKWYYDTGVWNKQMVWHAVGKEKITPEEYGFITGEKYTGMQESDFITIKKSK